MELHPDGVIDLAELRHHLAAFVAHEVEVDFLMDEPFAGAEKVLDRAEQPQNGRAEARLFKHFAQSRLLGGFPGIDRPFREPPPRPATGGDHRDMSRTLTNGHHCAAARMLPFRLLPLSHQPDIVPPRSRRPAKGRSG